MPDGANPLPEPMLTYHPWYPMTITTQQSITKISLKLHYIDVIITTMGSQVTSLTVVYSTVYPDANQRKHQSSASLAYVWGIHRERWIPRTKGQLRGKCFHLMTLLCVSKIPFNLTRANELMSLSRWSGKILLISKRVFVSLRKASRICYVWLNCRTLFTQA